MDAEYLSPISNRKDRLIDPVVCSTSGVFPGTVLVLSQFDLILKIPAKPVCCRQAGFGEPVMA